jgi:hypothetical protein
VLRIENEKHHQDVFVCLKRNQKIGNVDTSTRPVPLILSSSLLRGTQMATKNSNRVKIGREVDLTNTDYLLEADGVEDEMGVEMI